MTAGSQEAGRRDGGAPHQVHMCQRRRWPGNAHPMATSLAHSLGDLPENAGAPREHGGGLGPRPSVVRQRRDYPDSK